MPSKIAQQPLVDLIAGARPNFVKLAPVLRAIQQDGRIQPRIVHTGQHFDYNMNEVFFRQLGIPASDVHLGVGSGTHGAQTARILESYEKLLLERSQPAATVVFGDVNSTVACALAAAKLQVPVAHVEAGLRSFDRSMPEEVNRMLTDAIAELLLVSEASGVDNLVREGKPDSSIRLVGNVMIDTLLNELGSTSMDTLEEVGVEPASYGLVTMHRPSNVDPPEVLGRLVDLLCELGETLTLVFPIHPRTHKSLTSFGHLEKLRASSGVSCLEPCSYRDMLALMRYARVVLTDSGGMQEETTVLKVPCLTLRDTTERPVTIDLGTSRLVGNDPEAIRQAFGSVIAGQWPDGQEVPLWDGRAGERVARELAAWLNCEQ
jgi:UDP-N-acetylglucosamine 2-epimerase (non-hydrolysing)